jgi:hypothetical protein
MSTNLFIFFVFMFATAGILSAIIDGRTGFETTELTSAITPTSTSLPVKTTAPFDPKGTVMLGEEFFCYTSKTSNAFMDVTRGEDCRASNEASAYPVDQLVMAQSTGVINTLVGFDIASAFSDGGITGFFKGLYTSVKNTPKFLTSVAKMLLWDFSYLDGPFVYIKYLVLYPLSAGLVLGFVRMALGK